MCHHILLLLLLQSDSNVAPQCGQSGRIGDVCSNEVRIYVDNTLVWGGNTSGTLRISLSNNLGWVNSGQTIYVAFGPGTIGAYDSFNTDFTVSRGILIPHPFLQPCCETDCEIVLSPSILRDN
jgi:hypothetical protein